jgi:L-ascorbate metabolism protein UlaG (beta-lactamase superfamily)
MTDAQIEFIGTATTLIRCGPFTLLTDPNFLHKGQLAWLGHGLISRRLTEPAIGVDQLPDLDFVLLSHLHGDHWDRVGRRGLDSGLPIITTPHASKRLQWRHGFRRAHGLRTWETFSQTKSGETLTVTSLPAVHAHGVISKLLPPVMGSLLELADAAGRLELRLYITGDTLMFDGIREIARRYGDIDAAVVHLGGTTLPGGMIVTLDGEQGAELVDVVRPQNVLPVHYDDYGLFRSPLSDFRHAVERRGLGHLVRYIDRGQTAQIAPVRIME